MSDPMSRRLFLARSSAVTAATAATAVMAAPVRAASVNRTVLRVSRIAVRQAAVDDPTEATLAEAVTLLQTGKLTSVKLVQAYLDRINTYGSVYQAFVTVTGDQALAEAKKADERPTGVLSGIPLCIKDNYFTAGIRTTANSFIFDQFVPDYDATGVARLKKAGGI